MISKSLDAQYRGAPVRLTFSTDDKGTILNIDNFPSHSVVYLDHHSARALAERIINVLDNQAREAA